MKKILTGILLMAIICSLGGCGFVYDNQGWDDLPPWERNQVRTEMEELTSELKEEMAADLDEVKDTFLEMKDEFRDLREEMRNMFYER